MTDTTTQYRPATTTPTEESVLVDLRALTCGGCGFGHIAAAVTSIRARGERKVTTLRTAYCVHCGRTSPRPLTIAEFPAGGWQAMADALASVPRPAKRGKEQTA